MRKNKSLFIILLGVLFLTCDKQPEFNEDILSQEVIDNENSLNKPIRFNELSPGIIENVKNMDLLFEYSVNKGKDVIFGEVIKDIVIINENEELGNSYTLRIEKKDKGLYFDNLVVQELPDGQLKTNVIRYTPDKQWYERTKYTKGRFASYTGGISVFREDGTWLSDLTLTDGEITESSTDMTTSQCFYKTSYTIGCAYSCWVESVIIHVYCPGENGGGSTTYVDENATNSFGQDSGGSSGSGSDPSSGSGGGGTIGTSPFDEFITAYEEEEWTPPSCKSFNFQNTATNWQEASVVNIRFNILLIEIVGGVRVRKRHLFTFPQPVKFGMPRKFANGTSIPAGLAAEIGARSINHAVDELISKYYNLAVSSTSIVRSDFQAILKHEFQEQSNGGRVNFNDLSSTVTPTQYQTYGVLPDKCYEEEN